MKIINKIIKNFFIIFFFPYFFFESLIIILKNKNKIFKSKYIIRIDGVGYGHTLTLPDMIRYFLPMDETLIILSLDNLRHNHFVFEIYKIQKILFRTFYSFKIKNKTLSLGNNNYKSNFIIKFTNKLIKYFSKNNSVIFNSCWDFYDFVEKNFQHKNIEEFSYKYMMIYFYAIKINKLPKPILEEKFIFKYLKINEYKKLKQNKICCWYFRQKGTIENKESYYRSGGDENDYLKSIQYLINKGYTILLTGEEVISQKKLKTYNNNIIDFNTLRVPKFFFDIFAATECDIFIGEAGGGQFHGLYAKKSIMINYFPYGYHLYNSRMLYKNIIDENGNVLEYDYCLKKYKNTYNLKNNHSLVNNNKDQIYEHISKYINS